MSKEVYSEFFEVPCYMFDRNERLRPGAFMDIAQQLAAKGAGQFSMTDQDLARYHLVWILARMRVCFDSSPARTDRVQLRTWHRGLSGVSFIRDYEMLSGDGLPLARATSTWVIMNMDLRSIVRGSELGAVIPSEPQYDGRAFDADAAKIVCPRNAARILARRVRADYSYVDYNGHVNNARYIDWVFDSLPFELVFGRAVREFTINYNVEVHPGAEVDVFYTQTASDCYIVEGRGVSDSSLQHFICRVEF